jgi:preprotein translocase subunit SecG
MALLLFLPAGTLHDWQAWLFAVFFACNLVLTFLRAKLPGDTDNTRKVRWRLVPGVF